MADISKIKLPDNNTYNIKDSAALPKAGGTLTGRVTTTKAINDVITGTGTAAQDKGSSANPRYFPAKWTFNTGQTATNGDIVVIRVPVAGHSYGVYLSIDNGTNYYPISVNSTTRLTTHFAVNTNIALIFRSDGSTASMFPLNGSNSRVTVTGGNWTVLNFYDSNSDTNVTQTITTDSNDYRVLLSGNANDTTETTTARKGAGFTYNPSTSNLTVNNINGATPMRTTDIKDYAYSLGGVNSITSNADLNDYTTRGCYACNDSSLTITHKPSANLTSYAFRLYVQWDGNSSSSVQQIFDPYGQELRFARHYNGGSWSEWVLVDDDLNAIKDNIISNWGGAKNLATVTSGTFTAPSGTRYTTIPLSEGITGEVTVYFGNLTSDDTQGTTCAVVVSTPTTTLSTINMPRGSNVSATVTITDTATKILIYPAAGYSTSSGKTVTWSNLMVCSKADWDKTQAYSDPAMSNVELTAAIRALQAQLANL